MTERQSVYEAALHVLANMEYDEGTPADVLADWIATRAIDPSTLTPDHLNTTREHWITDRVRSFFEVEIRNGESMAREAGFDEAAEFTDGKTTTTTNLDNLLAASTLLALHALATSWLLDTKGDDAKDTEAMAIWMAESRDLTGGDDAEWHRAFELSVALFG